MKNYQGWEKDSQEISELEEIDVFIQRCGYFLIFVLLALAAVLSY